ncbi:MAG: hypothetical protein JST12_18125 [Armatimonadetes bacterium]|nr:hypothetical protein [Armatimonadota bacterium]MBS1703588.1 hypothetical protein [Armatimonadota bacterium]MBS1729118.1 hypothetical protein [Armatimonadota bacterium]
MKYPIPEEVDLHHMASRVGELPDNLVAVSSIPAYSEGRYVSLDWSGRGLPISLIAGPKSRASYEIDCKPSKSEQENHADDPTEVGSSRTRHWRTN